MAKVTQPAAAPPSRKSQLSLPPPKRRPGSKNNFEQLVIVAVVDVDANDRKARVAFANPDAGAQPRGRAHPLRTCARAREIIEEFPPNIPPREPIMCYFVDGMKTLPAPHCGCIFPV